MSNRFSKSFFDEWAAMFSGRFVPYHKLSVLVATIVSLVFSIAFSHDVVFEAPVSVIDLDTSRWSCAFIEKLNASPYVSVREVLHSPANPRELTRATPCRAWSFFRTGSRSPSTEATRP